MDLLGKVSWGYCTYFEIGWKFTIIISGVSFENDSFTHNETMMQSNDSIINNSIQSDINMNNARYGQS